MPAMSQPGPAALAGELSALPELEGVGAHVAGEDGVLVLNGDSYVDADFAAFVADCRERAPTAALAQRSPAAPKPAWAVARSASTHSMPKAS